MKKCPVCEKTFDDSMRFCQTDGTPLLDFTEAPAEDPLKTTVVRQEDFASVIPPQEPFGDAPSKEDSGDLLQLPEEYDPMKTMVAPKESDFGLNLSEPKEETPVSPFETPIANKVEDVLPSPFDSKPSDFNAPEPPKFNEPSLSPPSFGDMSTPSSFEEKKDLDEPPPTAIYMPEANSFPPESSTPMSSSPFDRPMEKPQNEPIPSPFEPVKPQIPSFKEPVQPSSPFEQQTPFGGMEQQNQGFNQPVQNADWTPPTPPVSNWQDQGLGANTPFQPPVSGGGGQDQTMAIVSLCCGIAGFLICQLIAPVALYTGYTARKKAQENPAQFGGEGLALAGMILGAIGCVLLVLVILYFIFVFGFLATQGF